MGKKKTHSEYVDEVKLINPNIEVLGEYINNITPILHKCNVHNIEWYPFPNNILRGHGCKQCANDMLRKQRTKNHQQYVLELERIEANVITLEEYINARTPILHKCLIDGYEWEAKPNNILSGKGCPVCAGIIKKTHEKYIKEVQMINSNIEVLEKYINAKTPILHRCKIHNIKWKSCPNNILQGRGCCECLKEKISIKNSKTHEQYIKELKLINNNIISIDNYAGADTPILHKCLIDGCEWYARPNNILCGNGCPQCNESKGERKIRLWLEEHNIPYERQYKIEDCRDKKSLPFDYYLPTINKMIEYDGKQHFEPIEHFGGQDAFEIRVKHDNIKNEYCKNNGISLLRIPYYKNVEEELNNFLFI